MNSPMPEKPRKPLQRKTPLTSRSSLARTPFSRSQSCVGKTRDREPKPAKRRREVEWSETKGRKTVETRSQGLCEIRVRIPGICMLVGHSWHHILDRSLGGTWRPASGLKACGDGTRGCHGWVTDNPKAARDMGGWVRRSTDDPLTTPVLLASHEWPGESRWVLLDDEGGFVPVLDVDGAA